MISKVDDIRATNFCDVGGQVFRRRMIDKPLELTRQMPQFFPDTVRLVSDMVRLVYRVRYILGARRFESFRNSTRTPRLEYL